MRRDRAGAAGRGRGRAPGACAVPSGAHSKRAVAMSRCRRGSESEGRTEARVCASMLASMRIHVCLRARVRVCVCVCVYPVRYVCVPCVGAARVACCEQQGHAHFACTVQPPAPASPYAVVESCVYGLWSHVSVHIRDRPQQNHHEQCTPPAIFFYGTRTRAQNRGRPLALPSGGAALSLDAPRRGARRAVRLTSHVCSCDW